MPEKATLERAERDRKSGKAPSTQAGEFVREEIHHVREGKHGAANTKQAIAIGLSKARRAGVNLAPPAKGMTSARTRQQAKRDVAKGAHRTRKPSAKRSRAISKALDREPRSTASRSSLSRQSRAAAKKRTKADRSAAAKKAARTRKARRRGQARRAG
ncbi:MAG TPA: DNA-binding protein [Candidatus Binatia bacterium]|nr:DNA-binding protein [Candidatus Binatia bacterium]